MKQRHILVSGGIGAGKSAVGEALRARGILVIDADQVGHEVLAPGTPGALAVAERWPAVVEGGVVDRRALGHVVFDDPDQLAALEAITHQAIRDEIAARLRAASDELVAVELPLLSDLLGPGWLRVVVDAPDRIRIDRLEARGMDREEISARMAAQPSRAEWLASADFVIDNSGGRDELDLQIDPLLERISEASAPDPA